MKKIPLFRLCLAAIFPLLTTTTHASDFQAGAAVVSVTPEQFPVLINGSMTSHTADKVKTEVNARALVLDDGNPKNRLAIVITDSCMMPTELLNEAKALAAKSCSISPDHMLISATHTHSAPSSFGCLGTDPDPVYQKLLVKRLAKAIIAAEKNLEPARFGWTVAQAPEYTALRRWIRRPDRLKVDPFGNYTVRANMHPGYLSKDATGESGPEDPDLTLLSFQATDGRPIAVFANFSMHYYGDSPISADYFGLFSEGLKEKLAANTPAGKPNFVGAMSHGASGDIYNRDYSKPAPKKKPHDIHSYTAGLLKIALEAHSKIKYQNDTNLQMAQRTLPLNYRVPDKQRLEWAMTVLDQMKTEEPKTLQEVYAREAVLLHEKQKTEIILQAIRIGDFTITTTPNETYALTGLKLKASTPLAGNMTIELANGAEGYIPPPEQHPLGGYNTWPARSAGLEVQAEPKIVETLTQLQETVTGKPRRKYVASRGPAAQAIAKSQPDAWWRLDEFEAPHASDSSAKHNNAYYEAGVVFHLDGPRSTDFCEDGQANRSAHFAGGRLRSQIAELGNDYSLSLWIWNGMPNDGRPFSGWMFSRDQNHILGSQGDHLGIGGSSGNPGKLILQHGAKKQLVGKTIIPRWTWSHVALVRKGKHVTVYLNGKKEIDADLPADFPAQFEQVFLGGRSDNQDNWEGRLDEVAIYKRALTAAEVATLAK
ncbi:MAG: hypothetical protein L3J39_09970 [Verrucomicrobiales bacterium]|nr:hypothetical protein [Verrucomicrobiales bacterium]